MSRLARIVCDGDGCSAQIEMYAGEYYSRHMGGFDTPAGWYCLFLNEGKTTGDPLSVLDPQEPRYFCSPSCVATYHGQIKQPATTQRAPAIEKTDAEGLPDVKYPRGDH